MIKNNAQPSIDYHQEIVIPIFQNIRSSESCAIVGVSSMGKTRLLQFMLQKKTRQHYLQDKVNTTLLVWADCNRMTAISEWGLYEMLFTSIVETCTAAQIPLPGSIRELRTETIVRESALLAQRNTELLLRELCKERQMNLCIIFDEFDASLQYLRKQVFSNLRSMRDQNKYHLCYMLFTRDDPTQLRSLDEHESFYELLSKSIIGLHPHINKDALQVINIQYGRREHELQNMPVGYKEKLVQLSGGHPGLIVALIDALTNSCPEGNGWLNWAREQLVVHEECRKVWEGLRESEQYTLQHLANETSTSLSDRESLLLKGLITEENQAIEFFSPLFHHYVRSQATLIEHSLRVDPQSGQVWVEGSAAEQLTAKEFELIDYLFEHNNEVCSNEDIIGHLYRGDLAYGVSENTISALVRRVRQKIEPNMKRPRYLLNIKGRGYILTDGKETSTN